MLQPPRSLPGRVVLGAVVLLVLSGCSQAFNVARYRGDNEALFNATMAQYRRGRWDSAVAGFERLTLELPARDTLLPVAHFYLGLSHGKRKEHLLAAQAFTRVTESFADHHLADDAAFGTARSYQRLWRKPSLDASYGETALATYRLYLSMFPNGELRPTAERQLVQLQDALATKEYLNGMFYRRRKYYDSAIIYFRGVVTNYPDVPRARDAWLRLVETYREIKYAADAAEACEEARKRWPDDAEVRSTCPATAGMATPASPTPPTPPADTARREPPAGGSVPPTPPPR
jgi:outer membrane protein assembly factor BamD